MNYTLPAFQPTSALRPSSSGDSNLNGLLYLSTLPVIFQRGKRLRLDSTKITGTYLEPFGESLNVILAEWLQDAVIIVFVAHLFCAGFTQDPCQ